MKKSHQLLGYLLLLPFMGWVITGVFFFIKPGYKSAYENLAIKTYPLDKIHHLEIVGVDEIRLLRSVLGNHLLVKKQTGWLQLDPITYEVLEITNQQQTRRLIEDAIQINPERYGKIESIDGTKIKMSTDVTINLNWSEMSLYQSGSDTDFINWMYKVHYLQWTGIKAVDRVLGIVGLALVLVLAFLGMTISLRRKGEN
jgi:hypothetical protein